MFTGIVREQGRLAAREADAELRLGVDVPDSLADRLGPGDSVAVNGVCLTVSSRGGNRLWFDVSAETLSRTRLGALETGARLNLEPALSASDPLGGHFVTGHVDGVGEVIRIESVGRSRRMEIEVPEGLVRYVAEKGSITVDGVSLTVNKAGGRRFIVDIIPHTWSTTNMQDYGNGTLVNLEVDIIARYLARLVSERDGMPEESDITTEYLSRQGFTPPLSDDEEEEYENWNEAREEDEEIVRQDARDQAGRDLGEDAAGRD